MVPRGTSERVPRGTENFRKMNHKREVKGNVVDPIGKKIYSAKIMIADGRIEKIIPLEDLQENFILPGFVDAHIHIESSMATPVAFSNEAVRHGTIAVVTDPHEIGNVLGKDGVKFMIENSREGDIKFLFGVPSCVPATSFETSGAEIDSTMVSELLELDEVGLLAEVMNYPGVINRDEEVLAKILAANKKGYPIDGHAPGLLGESLFAYAQAGITTDHECFDREEAREKISKGMKILIREGSGAKNFEALAPLFDEHPEMLMFCTDDSHPDDLLNGHIDILVKRALKDGYDLFDVLRASSYNPVMHYSLNMGLLQQGDPADFIIVDNLSDLNVLETVINGTCVYTKGDSRKPFYLEDKPNKFVRSPITKDELGVEIGGTKINLIEAIDGELITRRSLSEVKVQSGHALSDPDSDILKLVVVNRYSPSGPAIAFIRGFGLKNGAMATSVAHDSHNIIAVGVTDDEIQSAINWVIANRGGMVVVDGDSIAGLPLPVAGIMSDKSVHEIGESYKLISSKVKKLGSTLKSPFMTLSFMSLLVIPEIKLSDKGLFDSNSFSFIPLFVQS